MTKCTELFEKLERTGNFCGLSDRRFRDHMTYWKEYREAEEKNGNKEPLSLREWENKQKKAAKVAKSRKNEKSSVRNDKGQLSGRIKKEQPISDLAAKTRQLVEDKGKQEDKSQENYTRAQELVIELTTLLGLTITDERMMALDRLVDEILGGETQ